MRLFISISRAASTLGLNLRAFRRKYIETGIIRPMIFHKSPGRNGGLQRASFIMVADLEKVQRAARLGLTSN